MVRVVVGRHQASTGQAEQGHGRVGILEGTGDSRGPGEPTIAGPGQPAGATLPAGAQEGQQATIGALHDGGLFVIWVRLDAAKLVPGAAAVHGAHKDRATGHVVAKGEQVFTTGQLDQVVSGGPARRGAESSVTVPRESAVRGAHRADGAMVPFVPLHDQIVEPHRPGPVPV